MGEPNEQNAPLSDEDLAALALTKPEWVSAYREKEACRALFEQIWTCGDEKRAVIGALFVAERLPGVVSRWMRVC